MSYHQVMNNQGDNDCFMDVNPTGSALQLFADLNKEGIRYSYSAELTDKADIELLISPSDADKARNLMAKSNYKNVTDSASKQNSIGEDWIGLDNESLSQVHLIVRYGEGPLKASLSDVYVKYKSANGGKLISFIGADGAGKTTLATFFTEWLSWRMDCKYVYLGTGDGKSSMLNRLKKRITRKSKGNSSSASHHERDVNKPLSLKKMIRRTAANIIYLSNDKYKYKTIRKIRRLIDSGTIVITDRYPQMDFPGIYDGPVIREMQGKGLLVRYNRYLAAKERELYSEMCKYNPDVVIKLIVTAEVSNQRKPCTEKEYEIVKRKVEITDKLHYMGSKEHIVDSNDDIEQTKRQISSIIWSYI